MERYRALAGSIDLEALDAKVKSVSLAGKKVVLNVITSGVNVPAWVLSDPDVETFEFIDLNPHHATYKQTIKVPVYWDTEYLKCKSEFIAKLGERYAGNPAVAGVMVFFGCDH